MSVRVTFDEKARSLLMGGGASRDLLTAIYRVTEQALLNAASHGNASRVDVALAMPRSGDLSLTVSDDGRGLPRGELVPGSGTAIMDAWCAVVGAEWNWRSLPAGGVRVVSTFAAAT